MEWFTNYNIKKEEHILLCLEYSELIYEIKNKAIDMNGNIIPNYRSIYIVPDKEKQEKFFDMSVRLSNQMRVDLINSGVCTYEEAVSKIIYVGCEKEFFKDRNLSKFYEYIFSFNEETKQGKTINKDKSVNVSSPKLNIKYTDKNADMLIKSYKKKNIERG